MGILDKLKDLISDMEEEELESSDMEEESEEPQEEESEEPQEEKNEAVPELPSYLECTEAESQGTTVLMREQLYVKVQLAELVADFERKKAQVLSLIEIKQKEIVAELESLRVAHNIPERGYTVGLPSSADKKVTFTKVV